MHSTQLTVGWILGVFSVFSAYVVYEYGYLGLFEQALTNAATIQVLLDLIIALSIVVVWMWRDAQKQRITPWPYLLLTVTLGSIGPLLYLVRRLGKDAPLFARL